MKRKVRGFYLLANDQMYTLLVAFLNSFRLVEPDLPACLIPFDDNCRRITSLAKQYNVHVYNNPTELVLCDEVGQSFHSSKTGHYRKMAMWDGPFDEFIYIDVDTVMLRSASFVFEYLKDYDFVVGHSDNLATRHNVWANEKAMLASLSERQMAFACGTGFICSHRGAIGHKSLRPLVAEGLLFRDAMQLHCKEQALLNYLIVKSSDKYTSLSNLGSLGADEDLPCECWAGDPNWTVTIDGSYYCGKRKAVLFIHWAGCWSPRGVCLAINRMLNLCGCGPVFPIRKNLPMKEVWQFYRDRRLIGEVIKK